MRAAAAALEGGALATDEVMRRVEAGRPFRAAYREVAAALQAGERFAAPSRPSSSPGARSTGGLGNLGLGLVRGRLRRARAWQARERRRFERAMRTLAGRAAAPRVRPSDRLTAVMTADRRKRHLKILELISTRAVRTQEELAEALAAEGWEVTQSSVSRDIAALRLVKVDGAYRRPSAVVRAGGPRRAADRRRCAHGRARGGSARGAPHAAGRGEPGGGRARPAGVADVVGTIAGDDTIFLAVKDGSAQRRVIGEVRKLTST